MIGLIKDEIGGKVVAQFDEIRPKTYSYLKDDGKGTKPKEQGNVS